MPLAETSADDPRHEVRAGLAEIVHRVTGLAATEVLPERTFVDDLRVDSLAMVEILEGAASHFGVRVEDEAAKGFVRVEDLVAYLVASPATRRLATRRLPGRR